MNTPDSITNKIVKAADDRLRNEINEAFAPAMSLLNDGYPHRFTAVSTADGHPDVEVYFREAFAAMKLLAFEVNQKRNQEQAIEAFMNKVASLRSDVDNLYGELGL